MGIDAVPLPILLIGLALAVSVVITMVVAFVRGFRDGWLDAARDEDEQVFRGPFDDPNISDGELVLRRTAWFDAYTTHRNVYAKSGTGPFTCPCCAHLTLDERGGHEVCEECGWEDDGQDDHDSAVIRGGPNGRLSLEAARAAYVAGGGVRGHHLPPREPQ